MKRHMKKLLVAGFAAFAAVSLSACDEYDETPPLAADYLLHYIMPDGVVLAGEDWTLIENEEEEYNAFLAGSSK